ncbi:MAG: OmpA family protein [Phycisphaerales bacterium]|nr:OmpA family protein [Phycisphaerales bacterium]
MFLRTRFSMGLLGAVLMISVLGCQQPQKEPGTLDLVDRTAIDRIAELERQLADADQARYAAEDEAVRLRTENDRLREQLADRGTAADGWSVIPGGAMISIEGTILFDSGKATLKSTAKQTLDQMAQAIQSNYAGYEIWVFGHTDSQPIRYSGWKDNLQLSCERAAAVIRFLQSQGANQEMVACGWGTQRPVAENVDAKGRQHNRRVEVYAMAPKGAAAARP